MDTRSLAQGLSGAHRQGQGFARSAKGWSTVAFTGDTRGLQSAVRRGQADLSGFHRAAERNRNVNLTGDAGGLSSAAAQGNRVLAGFQSRARGQGEVNFTGDTGGLSSAATTGERIVSRFQGLARRGVEVAFGGDVGGLSSAATAGERIVSRFQGIARRGVEVAFGGDVGGLSGAAASANRIISSWRARARGGAEASFTGDTGGLASAARNAIGLIGDVESYGRSHGEVNFTGDASGLVSTAGTVRTNLGTIGGVAAGATTRVAGFSGILGAAGLAGAMGLAGAGAIGLNNRLEQADIGFTTMLGSGEKADRFLRELQTFAAATPFEFPDLVTSAQRMLAFGFAARDVKPLLTDVGNTAAAMGSGSAGVDAITTALGQMRATTVAQLGEMNQLTEQGVPALQLLADHLGISTTKARDMVEAGKVSAGTFIAAFQDFAGKNYPGMMAAQAETASGAFSTLKDQVSGATATAFRPMFGVLTDVALGMSNVTGEGSAFEGWANTVAAGFDTAIQKAGGFASKVQDAMRPPSDQAGGASMGQGGAAGFVGSMIQGVQSALPQVRSALGGVWSAISEGAGRLGTALKPALDDVVAGFRALQPALAPAGAFLKGVFQGTLAAIIPTVVTFARVGALAFRGVATAVGWLGKQLQPFTPQIEAIGKVVGFVFTNAVGGAVAAVARFVRYIPLIGRVAGPVFSAVGRAISFIGNPINAAGRAISWLGRTAVSAFRVIGRTFQTGARIAGGAFRGIGSVVGRVASTVGRAAGGIGRTLGRAWSGLGNLTRRAWSAISGFVRQELSRVGRFIMSGARLAGRVLSRAWSGLGNLTSRAWSAVSGAVRGALSAVGRFIQGGVRLAGRVLGAGWRAISGLTSRAWSGLSGLVSRGWTAITTAVTGGVNRVRSLLSAGWRAISSLTSRAWNGLSGLVGRAWSAIRTAVTGGINQARSVVSAGWRALSSLTSRAWSGIRNLLGQAWNFIRTTVSQGASAVQQLVSRGWSAIRSATSSAWSAIRGALGSAWSAIRRVVDQGVEGAKSLISRGWSAIKSGTSSAWTAVKTTVLNRVDELRAGAQNTLDNLRSAVSGIWEKIKSGTSSVWSAIEQAVTTKVMAVKNTVINTWNSMLNFVAGVLSKLGLTGAANDVRSGTAPAGGVSNPDRAADEQMGGPTGLYRGGIVDRRETVIVGDRQQREFVINPSRPDNRELIEQAADEMGLRVVPKVRSSARPHRRSGVEPFPRPRHTRWLIPPTQDVGSGEGLGPTMHTYIPQLRSGVIDPVMRQHPGTTHNTYSNHPMGYQQPYYRERSVDFWGAGGRGANIDPATGDAIANWVATNVPALNWLIWRDRMLTASGWGPDTSGFSHHGHVHVTAYAAGAKASGEGAGGSFTVANPLQLLFERLWRPVEAASNRAEDAMAAIPMIYGAAMGGLTDRTVNNIRDTIDARIPDTITIGGGDLGGGAAGGSAAENRAIGRRMNETAGWGSHWGALDNLWTRESRWEETADNPTSPAYGIPQANPGSKMASSGSDWRTNASTQIDWGLGYIKTRYGNPSNAWAHSQNTGWYASGGLVDGSHRGEQLYVVGDQHQREYVINPSRPDNIRWLAGAAEEMGYSVVKAFQAGGVAGYQGWDLVGTDAVLGFQSRSRWGGLIREVADEWTRGSGIPMRPGRGVTIFDKYLAGATAGITGSGGTMALDRYITDPALMKSVIHHETGHAYGLEHGPGIMSAGVRRGMRPTAQNYATAARVHRANQEPRKMQAPHGGGGGRNTPHYGTGPGTGSSGGGAGGGGGGGGFGLNLGGIWGGDWGSTIGGLIGAAGGTSRNIAPSAAGSVSQTNRMATPARSAAAGFSRGHRASGGAGWRVAEDGSRVPASFYARARLAPAPGYPGGGGGSAGSGGGGFDDRNMVRELREMKNELHRMMGRMDNMGVRILNGDAIARIMAGYNGSPAARRQLEAALGDFFDEAKGRGG